MKGQSRHTGGGCKHRAGLLFVLAVNDAVMKMEPDTRDALLEHGEVVANIRGCAML